MYRATQFIVVDRPLQIGVIVFLRLNAFRIFVVEHLSFKFIVIDGQGAQNPESIANKSVPNTVRRFTS
jgi:hypothetical protein